VERPIEGFTKGPLEGGMGMISGAGSLVSHTVSGVFNSVKNVVGTISSGLTKVTMDENY
jgi:vacuolar protein sorting-associated protein 13A/C